MRRSTLMVILLGLLGMLLVFGCTGSETAGSKHNSTSSTENATDKMIGTDVGTGNGSVCAPEYSFSQPSEGTLSKNTSITITARCAQGKRLSVKLGEQEVAGETLDGNTTSEAGGPGESQESQQVTLTFAPSSDGMIKLSVEADNVPIYSQDWKVKALGSDDIRGSEYDSVSFREWRTMAVDVESSISPSRIRAYIKRISARVKPQTNILAELREDSRNNPGGLVALSRRPINVTTLNENWINFDFENKPTIKPGRYWLVLKIEQTDEVDLISDAIDIRYVAIDKQNPGNSYTREMRLDVDRVDGVASETQWRQLSYDKTYAIVLSSKD